MFDLMPYSLIPVPEANESRDYQTFSVKEQIINNLDSVGHTVCHSSPGLPPTETESCGWQ